MEYAAQVETPGDSYGDLDMIAWHVENSGGRPHSVGQKSPNALGLHDMLGNVWEWVQDWYGDYLGRTVTDPRGAESGVYRVIRGCDWSSLAGYCRPQIRAYGQPGYHSSSLGFRLLRTEP